MPFPGVGVWRAGFPSTGTFPEGTLIVAAQRRIMDEASLIASGGSMKVRRVLSLSVWHAFAWWRGRQFRLMLLGLPALLCGLGVAALAAAGRQAQPRARVGIPL